MCQGRALQSRERSDKPVKKDAEKTYYHGAEYGGEKTCYMEVRHHAADEPEQQPVYNERKKPEGQKVYREREDKENRLYEDIEDAQKYGGLDGRAVTDDDYARHEIGGQKDAGREYYYT